MCFLEGIEGGSEGGGAVGGGDGGGMGVDRGGCHAMQGGKQSLMTLPLTTNTNHKLHTQLRWASSNFPDNIKSQGRKAA